MKKRHVNIPIFIPHMGCPNNCVFCNQRTISGHTALRLESVREEIEAALATIPADAGREIAFFGGSFTGIDRDLMILLLEIASEYVESGQVDSIRLSTRPDYIDAEILQILSKYHVKVIELGLQSLSENVLLASKRGHSVEVAERAIKEVKAAGFFLFGQMMIGLPSSDARSEIYTAKRICELGADAARVYPTVVFEGTELAQMMRAGIYTPPSLEEAVERTKNVLDVFDGRGIPCIRVGLCASENLADSTKAIGGCNHSAIGELAMSRLYFDRLVKAFDAIEIQGGSACIYVSKGAISKAVGQKKENKIKICKKYGLQWLKVLEKSEIMGYNIIIEYFCSEQEDAVALTQKVQSLNLPNAKIIIREEK